MMNLLYCLTLTHILIRVHKICSIQLNNLQSRENISNLESKLNESEGQLKERTTQLDSEVQTRLQV